jgi:hypothetical protein
MTSTGPALLAALRAGSSASLLQASHAARAAQAGVSSAAGAVAAGCCSSAAGDGLGALSASSAPASVAASASTPSGASSSWPCGGQRLGRPSERSRPPHLRELSSALPFGVRLKHTKSNLDEAAVAAGLSKPSVVGDWVSKLNDPSLVKTAAFIGGKWAETASDKQTFDVSWVRASTAAPARR